MSSNPAPPRRFAPEPIEQTTKSSKDVKAKEEKAKPRRFAPELVEETTKSSKETAAHSPAGEKPKPRRFAPEPVEHSTKSSKDVKAPEPETEKPKTRRFAPQAVEHSTKSSKDAKAQESEQEKPKPRRFAPLLVEETEKSSKDKGQPEKELHVKFKPEVIATTYGGNRKAKQRGEPECAGNGVGVGEEENKPPRKFTPILLDTATRSRRRGDPNAPIGQDYRTEYGYHAHARDHWKRLTGQVTPSTVSEVDTEDYAVDSDRADSPSPERPALRQVCALDGSSTKRPDCLKPARTHSFRMPDLDTIESSESEPDSGPSSPSPGPMQVGSPITASDSSYELFKHATRIRESIDESWTHYLLDLERKKAQQRLEEQALAAFPNADFGYEPPHHYFNEDDSDDMEIEDRPVTWDDGEDEDEDMLEMTRRESTADMSWEQAQMQKHAEALKQERTSNKPATKKITEAPLSKKETAMAAAQDESELKSMRDRARPPMLGSDLVFPRCPSPDPARFDVTQGSAALRNQMCYLTETAENERKRSGEDEGLWQVRKPDVKRISCVRSPAKAKGSENKGLWGGFCVDDGESEQNNSSLGLPTGPTGLMTPKPDGGNPFELAFTEGRPVGLMTPGTPTSGNNKPADLRRVNAVLISEREFDKVMEKEYPDSFITQVYNYLSLGYPSLARPFDDELAKISRFSISDLRQDDQKAKATPRGYIRLGSDFEGGGGEGMSEQSCVRWQALKRYIREWARQEKNMVKSDGMGGFGTSARRGSWAN